MILEKKENSLASINKLSPLTEMHTCRTIGMTSLTPSSHMEVGCPGTWGTGTADPKPKHPDRKTQELVLLAI